MQGVLTFLKPISFFLVLSRFRPKTTQSVVCNASDLSLKLLC